MALPYRQNTHPQVIIAVSAILFALCFGAIAIWKFLTFHYNALDLAIFNQVFFNTLHGHWFTSSIHPPSYLGDHISPIIFLLLPFYALAPHALTLVALQITALIASGWLVYRIALPHLGPRWATALSVTWFANPFVGNIALFEFSVLPFAALGILLAYLGYDQKKFGVFCGGLLIPLLCREDMALGVLAFTALAFIDHRPTKWWLTPLLLAITYITIVITVGHLLAPSAPYKFLIYYQWLGNTPGAALHTLITKPWLPIAMLARPGNILFVLVALLPVAFIPLAAPRALVLAAGFALQFMLGSAGAGLTVLQTQYAALFVAPIFIATIQGIKALRYNRLPNFVAKMIAQHRPLSPLLFVVTVLYGAYTLGPIPGSIMAMRHDDKRINEWQLVATIPTNAAVAATYDFLAPLSARGNLASFNYVFLGSQQFLQTNYALPTTTEYLLIDFRDLVTYQLQYSFSSFYRDHYQQALTRWPSTLAGFSAIAVSDTTVLFQRNAPSSITLVSRTEKPAATIDQPATIFVTQELTYLGARRANDHVELFWRATVPHRVPYRLKIQRADGVDYVPWAYDLLFGIPTSSEAYVQTNIWQVPDGSFTFSVVSIDGGGIDVDGTRGTKATVDHEQILTPTITVR